MASHNYLNTNSRDLSLHRNLHIHATHIQTDTHRYMDRHIDIHIDTQTHTFKNCFCQGSTNRRIWISIISPWCLSFFFLSMAQNGHSASPIFSTATSSRHQTDTLLSWWTKKDIKTKSTFSKIIRSFKFFKMLCVSISVCMRARWCTRLYVERCPCICVGTRGQ